jgi:hypothetical protein
VIAIPIVLVALIVDHALSFPSAPQLVADR